MNTIIINDNNMTDSDINKFGNKVRAILVKDNSILVAHYGGVILLPGGSIDKGETPNQAIVRELKEEIGIDYNINELNAFLILKYYQPNYPTRDNEIISRLITTRYYLGQYKDINIRNTRRTDKEIKDNFNLQLIEIEDLLKMTSEVGDNPRKEYFDREIKEVIKVLKK